MLQPCIALCNVNLLAVSSAFCRGDAGFTSAHPVTPHPPQEKKMLQTAKVIIFALDTVSWSTLLVVSDGAFSKLQLAVDLSVA